MKSGLLSTTFIAVLLGIPACSGQPVIDRADVTRIITTLAADDMEGRATFSEGIERAAGFIENEFDEIGLGFMPGATSYLQAFQVYSLTPGEQSFSLNGRPIPDESVFSMGNHEHLSWTTADNISVTRLGPDDDFRSGVLSRRGSTESEIILVDESHADDFARFRPFFSRPQRSTSLNEGGTTVFILTRLSAARTYRIEIDRTSETLDLANVVGVIPGNREEETVLFSGHYDHLGIRPAVNADSIANGANDDASGTTAVIELARYFKALGKPERTLIFAAFTAEEIGGYGSQHLSHILNPDQVVAMFNIEMIGKPAVDGPNTAWITGFDRSDFGTILQKAVEGTRFSFYPDPYPDQNLFYRSDNATLARLGVPAHSISTTPIDVDTDYHQVSDEVETLNLDHLTNTISAIAAGAATIVSGAETPTRIDPSTVN